ncbi:class F sortase [Catenuloplanes japonicus]|uniref:class F sortase n=1 Tax=Catenuloplanes japonicus TaxID=33876 RepID=UPI00068E6445|nr:class F sortase [Catenuloplanes japonicus]
MSNEVRARLRPHIAVVAAVLALAGTVLTVQGARQEAAAGTAESARVHATGFPELETDEHRSGGADPASPGDGEPASPPGAEPSYPRGEGWLLPAPTTSDETGAIVPAPPATGARMGGGAPRWTPLPRSVPATLEIPAIGVRSSLLSLGLRPDGTVEVPPLTGTADAGWYRHSVTPGETGPAVILGHVDSVETGRGVFYRLTDLTRGAEILVTREDGVTVVFTVTSLRRYPKAEFPTERVYGPTDAPTIRLATCGGAYDQISRTYVDNVVVYATAAPATATPEAGDRPDH